MLNNISLVPHILLCYLEAPAPRCVFTHEVLEPERPHSTIADPMPQQRARLEAVLEQLNRLFTPVFTQLQFALHDETGELVLKVIDTLSKKVIRQIPSETVVQIGKILQRLQDWEASQQIAVPVLLSAGQLALVGSAGRRCLGAKQYTQALPALLLQQQA